MNLQSKFQVSLFDFNSMFSVLLELDFGNRILQDTARVLRAHCFFILIPMFCLFLFLHLCCLLPLHARVFLPPPFYPFVQPTVSMFRA